MSKEAWKVPGPDRPPERFWVDYGNFVMATYLYNDSDEYWQTLMPEAVHEDKNGYLGMQYDVLAMLGVISVARKVVSHEERIAALEAENERLKKEIEQLKS
mgnify:CR=1 FL=1